MNRKEFLTLAGGTLGMMLLKPGEAPGKIVENISAVNTNTFNTKFITTDVLVIGGGMAGLFAAVKAKDNGSDVVIVSKGRLGSSGQTPFAKGIFSYDKKNAGIGINEFIEAVSKSASGSNNKAYTKQLALYSKERVDELREWGFFDSSLYNSSFMKPIEERKIKLYERIVITNLIMENDVLAGAAGFGLDDESLYFFNSKSVILCTGAGGFKPNGFPICDLTHDGSVMAYEIGAKITGKEWVDGHPGQSDNPAACYDSWHGMFEKKPEITNVEIRHDLGVDLNYKAYKYGSPVKMHPPGPPPGENRNDNLKRRPPRMKDGERDAPPGMHGNLVGGSSAGLSIHKSEGLTPVNENCESTIKGLYAAGDALGSHMSGGIYTQIGSSLAGSAVQGAVAGTHASGYSKSVKLTKISKQTLNKISGKITAPLKRKQGYSPAWVTQTLQSVMIPNFVLYIKKENMLKAALAYVEELKEHHVPMLKAEDYHELRLAHETKNMIINAEMKLRASILRKESRGSHFRLDYPEEDNKNWRAWINISMNKNGEMILEKQPFDYWPDGKKIII